MRTRGLITLAVVTSALLVSCSVDPTVTAERSDQIATHAPTETTPANTGPATTAPETTDPTQTDPTTTDPTGDRADRSHADRSDEHGSVAERRARRDRPDGDRLRSEQDPARLRRLPARGDDRPRCVVVRAVPRRSTAMPSSRLSGGVYAAYPNRPDDLPGCGEPRTTYDEVQQFVAFYCGQGDFIIYDDGDEGLLAQLAGQYGPGTIGIVFAHEFGHAIQTRAGALDRDLPTVYTEQQADCFAGAWAGRVSRGESSVVSFSDADVRSGLIAMTKVSDPVGLNQFVEGGHGSAFDRVGAFQVGFNEGVARCAELLDSPLPLSLNQFSEIGTQHRRQRAARVRRGRTARLHPDRPEPLLERRGRCRDRLDRRPHAGRRDLGGRGRVRRRRGSVRTRRGVLRIDEHRVRERTGGAGDLRRPG